MSFPTRTNAIDFNSARLQRFGFSPAQFLAQPLLDYDQLQRRLGLQLQTSLEADKVLAMFFQSVQQLIPLGALIYRHEGTDLRLELGARARHDASYCITYEGEQMGQLTFQRDQAFGEDELAQLESLLSNLIYPLRNALLYRHASLSALRDPLTGAGNRIAMEQSLSREAEIARRHQQPLSALMLDIDHFKGINDTHGHVTGDEVLKAVADMIKDRLRNIDQVFRFGGEEFLIVLTNTPRESAALVGERLRQAILQLKCPANHSAAQLTISLGCATLLPGESPDSLVRRADSALYAAKRQGRNRLEMAG
ncbi:GGDEF domain-containing protein [Pseudomonas sp. LP_7_YM]|uniref:GGDEF domain-containing protein n=1 Tax=Pseudomonas sp. LP_7_YM TaxID=2485137 RepID=UPI00105CD6B0|nr:GGDEF domain-containing protein [Pseudomonas sp. LP_7_YM]TDV70381.1 diguanylate cyclase (GGDEF)-like protein [Pseudomonas sp. LP_7_YM]